MLIPFGILPGVARPSSHTKASILIGAVFPAASDGSRFRLRQLELDSLALDLGANVDMQRVCIHRSGGNGSPRGRLGTVMPADRLVFVVNWRVLITKGNSMRLSLAAAAIAALFAADLIGLPVDAAPITAPTAKILSAPSIVTPVVTRAGVAHRSARRTARRVNRRHYY